MSYSEIVGRTIRILAAGTAVVVLGSCAAGDANELVTPSRAAATRRWAPVTRAGRSLDHPLARARSPAPKRAMGARSPGDRLLIRSRLRARPTHVIAARNPIDQRLVFTVIRRARTRTGKWLKILLAERPNGSSAWVRQRAVDLVRLRHRVVVDLSAHRLSHYRNDRLLHTFRVGVGTARTPTPTGRFFVWARVQQPDPGGPYGVFALGLSGFSPVLTDWAGGGRAAVHGTSNPADRGRAVSHGCVRAFNPQMMRLRTVPMGTPVIIRA